jgi:hypothetical protein
VAPSERIRAAHLLPEMEHDLEAFIQERHLQKHLKQVEYQKDFERRRRDAEDKG